MKESIIDMTQNMRTVKYIRLIFVFAALFFGTGSEMLAQSSFSIDQSDIVVTPSGSGTVVVKATGGIVTNSDGSHTVTIVVTPNGNNIIKRGDIKVQKLLDPAASPARRRTPDIADYLTVEGPETTTTSGEYRFTVPSGYHGAYIVATFRTVIMIPSSTAISYNHNGYYMLTDNVSASQLSALITGSEATPFEGIFEGVAKTDGTYPIITGLRNPLFAKINGGTVKNVMLKDVQIEQDGPVGAIAGTASGYSRIYNCGILPTSNSTTPDNQYISTNEKSKLKSNGGSGSYCGGIVGWLKDDSRVINCFSYANITGGSEVAGIVGFNGYTSNTSKTDGDTKYGNLKTMVMNCMFYGDITGGSTKHPVYGGQKIDNNANNGINNYNYYRANRYEYNKEKDKYVDIDDVTFDAGMSIANYFCSWPAEAKYLTRYEFYRSILNANRPLAGWWVKSDVAPSILTVEQVQAIEKDASLMAKWVVEPAIAPYPILKPQDSYYSIVNPNPDKVWNVASNSWINRTQAKSYEGKNLGSITVTVDGLAQPLTLQILDMDTLNHDYCYAKVQLPYYNELFGKPNATSWSEKYGGNYTDKVVTGWEISSVSGGTVGTFKGKKLKGTTNIPNITTDNKAWEDGFNFADRNCTAKDIYTNSGRIFAQGGYYYVPVDVDGISIKPHWAAARYVCNADYSYDRVQVAGYPFEPAGTIPNTFHGQKVWSSIKEAITGTDTNASTFYNVGNTKAVTVYDQAIVLIGNIQLYNQSTVVGNAGDSAIPFTLMSADFDFDNEPDYCLDLQFRAGIDRPRIQPIRFDFLPIPDLGLANRVNEYGYSIGIMVPLGHFEITETAIMHTTQFEYDGVDDTKIEAPVILNGGQFEQIVVRKGNNKKTAYFLMGGHFRIGRFTPGSHTNNDSGKKTRHCAVNVLGGEYPEFYLSGYYRTDANPESSPVIDNPHCYINGGKFGTIAGAGVEKIRGSVTFQIDHAVIRGFYGGGINANNPISGNITVTINNSKVDKYCGGPQVGDMSVGTTITTKADGTTFGEYYGGGNGGTSFFREQVYDGDTSLPTKIGDWNGFNAQWKDANSVYQPAFSPLNEYNENKGYYALYDFEMFNSSNGRDANVVKRAYIKWARFAKTQTGSVINELNGCILNCNFYGGGNLAAVGGVTESGVDLGNCSVVSTLTNTTVNGSAYGGGYSASIPSFRVHDKSTFQIPTRDKAGVITDGEIDYQKDNDTSNDGSVYKYFTWSNSASDRPEGVTLESDITTSSPTSKGSDGKYYCYSDKALTNLGTVTGLTSITINGSSTITGSVFGGGDESLVTGNTTVTLAGNATVNGSVYGGGNRGVVSGTSTVNIEE